MDSKKVKDVIGQKVSKGTLRVWGLLGNKNASTCKSQAEGKIERSDKDQPTPANEKNQQSSSPNDNLKPKKSVLRTNSLDCEPALPRKRPLLRTGSLPGVQSDDFFSSLDALRHSNGLCKLSELENEHGHEKSSGIVSKKHVKYKLPETEEDDTESFFDSQSPNLVIDEDEGHSNEEEVQGLDSILCLTPPPEAESSPGQSPSDDSDSSEVMGNEQNGNIVKQPNSNSFLAEGATRPEANVLCGSSCSGVQNMGKGPTSTVSNPDFEHEETGASEESISNLENDSNYPTSVPFHSSQSSECSESSDLVSSQSSFSEEAAKELEKLLETDSGLLDDNQALVETGEGSPDDTESALPPCPASETNSPVLDGSGDSEVEQNVNNCLCPVPGEENKNPESCGRKEVSCFDLHNRQIVEVHSTLRKYGHWVLGKFKQSMLRLFQKNKQTMTNPILDFFKMKDYHSAKILVQYCLYLACRLRKWMKEDQGMTRSTLSRVLNLTEYGSKYLLEKGAPDFLVFLNEMQSQEKTILLQSFLQMENTEQGAINFAKTVELEYEIDHLMAISVWMTALKWHLNEPQKSVNTLGNSREGCLRLVLVYHLTIEKLLADRDMCLTISEPPVLEKSSELCSMILEFVKKPQVCFSEDERLKKCQDMKNQIKNRQLPSLRSSIPGLTITQFRDIFITLFKVAKYSREELSVYKSLPLPTLLPIASNTQKSQSNENNSHRTTTEDIPVEPVTDVRGQDNPVPSGGRNPIDTIISSVTSSVSHNNTINDAPMTETLNPKETTGKKRSQGMADSRKNRGQFPAMSRNAIQEMFHPQSNAHPWTYHYHSEGAGNGGHIRTSHQYTSHYSESHVPSIYQNTLGPRNGTSGYQQQTERATNTNMNYNQPVFNSGQNTAVLYNEWNRPPTRDDNVWTRPPQSNTRAPVNSYNDWNRPQSTHNSMAWNSSVPPFYLPDTQPIAMRISDSTLQCGAHITMRADHGRTMYRATTPSLPTSRDFELGNRTTQDQIGQEFAAQSQIQPEGWPKRAMGSSSETQMPYYWDANGNMMVTQSHKSAPSLRSVARASSVPNSGPARAMTRSSEFPSILHRPSSADTAYDHHDRRPQVDGLDTRLTSSQTNLGQEKQIRDGGQSRRTETFDAALSGVNDVGQVCATAVNQNRQGPAAGENDEQSPSSCQVSRKRMSPQQSEGGSSPAKKANFCTSGDVMDDLFSGELQPCPNEPGFFLLAEVSINLSGVSGPERSGPPAAESSGPPALERSGTPAPERSGQPAPETSEPPALERSGPPALERSGPPALEISGPPALERNEPPALEISGPPALERNGPPALERNGPPALERNGPPALERNGPPALERSGPPALESSGPPALESSGPPAPVYEDITDDEGDGDDQKINTPDIIPKLEPRSSFDLAINGEMPGCEFISSEDGESNRGNTPCNEHVRNEYKNARQNVYEQCQYDPISDDDNESPEDSNLRNSDGQPEGMECNPPNSQNQSMECNPPISQNQSMECKPLNSQNQSMECNPPNSQNQSMECKPPISQNQSMECNPPNSQDQSMKCNPPISQNQSMECNPPIPQNQSMETSAQTISDTNNMTLTRNNSSDMTWCDQYMSEVRAENRTANPGISLPYDNTSGQSLCQGVPTAPQVPPPHGESASPVNCQPHVKSPQVHTGKAIVKADLSCEDIIRELEARESLHSCECGMSFPDNITFIIHQGSHSHDGSRQCRDCGYKASSWLGFHAHMFNHN